MMPFRKEDTVSDIKNFIEDNYKYTMHVLIKHYNMPPTSSKICNELLLKTLGDNFKNMEMLDKALVKWQRRRKRSHKTSS